MVTNSARSRQGLAKQRYDRTGEGPLRQFVLIVLLTKCGKTDFELATPPPQQKSRSKFAVFTSVGVFPVAKTSGISVGSWRTLVRRNTGYFEDVTILGQQPINKLILPMSPLRDDS